MVGFQFARSTSSIQLAMSIIFWPLTWLKAYTAPEKLDSKCFKVT